LKIDLNFPDFQKDLFKLQKKELYALIKTFRTLSRMDFDQLRSSSGLNLEQVKKAKTRKGNPLYSVRITRSFRAILSIEGDYLRFVSLHPGHDSAYKR
jgi:mRNA-degrading endonuclease RelE of RelBE toxin-antitoxin system